ncbi:MAG: enoyl-CoA hydratase-related protein, partial [Bacteroidetes bacterium]|nr:enoyl-CoA hydratase-related protein [Bacteroidota bacterium]
GLMPGAGDTQRLPRTVRKHRAMKIVLTGKMFGAEEAMRWGLVNKVVPAELCIEEAVRLANLIASNPPVAVRLAKGAVRKSLDFPLGEGLAFERKNLYPLFPTYDQTEGMNAFIERRKAVWKGR